MRLKELLDRAGIFDTRDIPDILISEIVTNSTKADRGSLFVCLEGAKNDGHRHVREALMLGAVAVVVQYGTKVEMPPCCENTVFIYCENTRRAAAKLYNAWYGCPTENLKIIAVTGTNGKTSTVTILKRIFESAFYKCGIIGTVECVSGEHRLSANPDSPLANMTTPDPKELYRTLAFMAADGVEYVFMEASSHALKLSKLDAIEFDTAIFTNLTPEHLDFHDNMEDYKESKAKLFSMSRTALINADDPSGKYMISHAKGKVYTYSPKGEFAFFRAENVNVDGKGIAYTLVSKNWIMKIKSPLSGGFNVDNTLAAVSCALICGISPATVSEALRSMPGVTGRMEKIDLGVDADFSVYIDYAHTPDALKNLMLSAKEMSSATSRLVLLFGCGGDRDKTKRAVMGKIASSMASMTIITSDNSRGEKKESIIEDIMQGFDNTRDHVVIPDRREAIEFAIMNARAGDVILLAGKGHEKYEIDTDGKHPFDERQIVRNALKKRAERYGQRE
jgi:UDP-N-acetylmuramoyl-L-alanyl-D-glutamate--2,6-diaminopimelate ligase